MLFFSLFMDIADNKVDYQQVLADVPQQVGGNDCGVFCLAYASYVTSDKEITTSPNQVRYFSEGLNIMLYNFLFRVKLVNGDS